MHFSDKVMRTDNVYGAVVINLFTNSQLKRVKHTKQIAKAEMKDVKANCSNIHPEKGILKIYTVRQKRNQFSSVCIFF